MNVKEERVYQFVKFPKWTSSKTGPSGQNIFHVRIVKEMVDNKKINIESIEENLKEFPLSITIVSSDRLFNTNGKERCLMFFSLMIMIQ